MNTLPLELLYTIARVDESVFLAMAKAIPTFARDVSGRVGAHWGMMESFGYSTTWDAERLVVQHPSISIWPSQIAYDGTARWKTKSDSKFWCDGVLHRANGPAVVYPNGDYMWWNNGVCERVGGPAVYNTQCASTCTYGHHWNYHLNVYSAGTCVGVTEWMVHNALHRVDGPARVFADGRQEWYVYGQLHRTDGPAVIYPDGGGEYWIDGKMVHQ